ncbi:uncharacterized protein LOC34620792 [Cyclospora cayetanensis]|uniref:Uncharacterized protein LOC34620792 n=1 Tax=Cyclospora cayetanensis TaxID=88456 RepID=A0A6P6S2W9_9EIME|nr:uncharacterized protein LOC34620792 [Cyclospora cayetanensis]
MVLQAIKLQIRDSGASPHPGRLQIVSSFAPEMSTVHTANPEPPSAPRGNDASITMYPSSRQLHPPSANAPSPPSHPLSHLCEPASSISPSSNANQGESDPAALALLPGMLLGVEGKLRKAISMITDTLGPVTLPCLFVGGGVLGAAVATASFRTRMRKLGAAVPTTARATGVKTLPAGGAAGHRAPLKGNTAQQTAATSSPAATGEPQLQASSILAAELARHRKRKSWELDDEDEEDWENPRAGEQRQTLRSAADLFTARELATLFLLPACFIGSVLGGGWIFFKYQCGIHDVSLT